MLGRSPILVINFFNIFKETIGLFIPLCLQNMWFQWVSFLIKIVSNLNILSSL